jgi:hypothetical protein
VTLGLSVPRGRIWRKLSGSQRSEAPNGAEGGLACGV